MNLKKQIIVTGANEGIGKAIVESLDPLEWRVGLISKDKKKGEFTCKYWKSIGYDCMFYCIDLANPVQLSCDWQRIVSDFNNVYALINNAGCGFPSKIEDLCVDEIENILRVNLVSPLLLIGRVVEMMKKTGVGRIINISSVAGKLGVPFLTVYGASKAGLIVATQSLAKELGKSGITVNCICPAGVDTRLAIEGRKRLAKLSKIDYNDLQNEMLDDIGLNRTILSEEIARVVDFLLEEKSSGINGQSINICGSYEVR